jgi:cephalosporin hydroxylase
MSREDDGMNLLDKFLGRSSRTAVSRSNPMKNPGCTQFEVDAWQLSGFVLERLVPVVGIHPFPLTELMLLAGAVCRQRPSHIFEWGTHIGKSARAFYEITSYYGIPSEIHSVDLPDETEHVEHPSSERGRMVRGLDRVHLHQGDGVDTSLAIWRKAAEPNSVLFFVDGDHAEKSVYRELSAIVGAVAKPAVLLHDAFYQSPESSYNVGPYQAIERVLAEHRGRFKRLDTGLGLPGMTLLYPA